MTFSSILLVAMSVFSVCAFAQPGDDAVRLLHVQAVQAVEGGQYEEARQSYVKEINLLLAKGRQAEAAGAYTELGEITQIHGSFSAAEGNYRNGRELLERYGPPNDLRLVTVLDDLGWLYVTWGRITDGSRLLDQARKKAETARSDEPTLIRHLDTQAAYLVVVGKYSEAQKAWTRALEIGSVNYGPDGPEYDNVLVHFGQGSALYGDFKVAEHMFRRYMEIEGRVSQAPSTAHAVVAGELARVYMLLHKYSEAQTWFDDATGILNNNPDEAPLVRSMVLSYLGDYYMVRGDWANAQNQYRETLKIQRDVLGENRAVASSMISLSNALKKLHLKDEARELTNRAKAIFAAQPNAVRDQTVDVMALRRE
jgi:tetratricopeptide (TPR) repeat protein